MTPALLLAALLGCSEYSVHDEPPPPVAEPPGRDPDAVFGDPPADWESCAYGFLGAYQNLPIDHPDMEPDPEAAAPVDPALLDWWDPDYLSFQDYDGSLDIGSNWWPVDDGLEGDPAYFSVRWTAWLRVWRDDSPVSVQLGAQDDAWIIVNEAVVASLPGVHDFEPETITLPVVSGQYPIDIRYAHRAGGESGFRFRIVEGDADICYPDFSGLKD